MARDLIAWHAPWLAPYHATGLAIAKNMPSMDVAQALNTAWPLPVRFVSPSQLPDGCAYEQFIFDTQTVPTRNNLHDFFNGLCWLTFPHTKTKLNQLQAAQLAQSGVQPTRGVVRDALTLFDENAAFFCAPQPLWDALIAKDWQRLFVVLRPLWRHAQLVLFGHALLEKLVAPRKPITAHVYRAQRDVCSIAELDRWVASGLTANELACKPFAPMPVLGAPGWWPDNEDFSFYADTLVFRPQSNKVTGACQRLV